MSKTLAVLATLLFALCLNGATAQTCSSMFAGLRCRTASEDPSKVDSGAVAGARAWLCGSYPNMCTAINSGGQYGSCNNVEQLSYAMDQYYSQFQSQGASACSFGGIAVLASSTPATTQSSNGNAACQSMFASLSCRTSSEDPTKVDSNAVAGSRAWLCGSYPNMCTAINSGGQYASCNNVEQLSFAMNQYYTQFQSQGASACSFGGIGQLVISATPATSQAAAAPASTVATADQCASMYAAASCRTKSSDPAQVDSGAVAGSRGWLCSVYPQFCLAITTGGAYTSCNSVQQLTFAMSLYYNQYQSQGASACNFGGLAQLNTAVTPVATPSTSSAVAVTTPTVDCSAMYNSLSCRTPSQDPNSVSAGSISGARSWLCTSYPALCTAINSGGQYASCNNVQQLSYAMNAYYTQFSYQGSSACNFGGVAQLVGSNTPAPVVNPTPVPQKLSSKCGLAWPINQFGDGSNPSLAPWTQGAITWIYTWNWDFVPLSIPSNVEWVPMLHSQTEAGSFIAKINSGAYDNVKNLLLFNEPDLNYPPYAYGLDVNTAISITLQVFQAIRARGINWRVGTPAMSYNQGWLSQYLAGVNSQCPTCKFSFVPVHCYTTDSNAFKATVQSYYNAFGLPIWVTEFAATDFNNRNWQMSLPQVQSFMSDTMGWLNSQSWVERFSWFGVMRAVDIQDKANIAMNMDGSRNTLGDQYVLRGGSQS